MSSTEKNEVLKNKRINNSLTKELTRICGFSYKLHSSGADYILEKVQSLDVANKSIADYLYYEVLFLSGWGSERVNTGHCLAAALAYPPITEPRMDLLEDLGEHLNIEFFSENYQHLFAQKVPKNITKWLTAPKKVNALKKLEELNGLLSKPTFNPIKLNIILNVLKDSSYLLHHQDETNSYQFWKTYKNCSQTHIMQALVKSADRWAEHITKTDEEVLIILDCSASFHRSNPNLFEQAASFACTMDSLYRKTSIMLTCKDSDIFNSSNKSILPKIQEITNNHYLGSFNYKSIKSNTKFFYDKILLLSDKIHYSGALGKEFENIGNSIFHVNLSGCVPRVLGKDNYSVSGLGYTLYEELNLV